MGQQRRTTVRDFMPRIVYAGKQETYLSAAATVRIRESPDPLRDSPDIPIAAAVVPSVVLGTHSNPETIMAEANRSLVFAVSLVCLSTVACGEVAIDND